MQFHPDRHNAPQCSHRAPHTPTRLPSAAARPPNWQYAWASSHVTSTMGMASSPHPGLSGLPISARLRRHLPSCRRREAFVGPHRHFRLPQPETFGDGHLVRRFFNVITLVVSRRAAHHKRPWWNPNVLQPVLALILLPACCQRVAGWAAGRPALTQAAHQPPPRSVRLEPMAEWPSRRSRAKSSTEA